MNFVKDFPRLNSGEKADNNRPQEPFWFSGWKSTRSF